MAGWARQQGMMMERGRCRSIFHEWEFWIDLSNLEKTWLWVSLMSLVRTIAGLLRCLLGQAPRCKPFSQSFECRKWHVSCSISLTSTHALHLWKIYHFVIYRGTHQRSGIPVKSLWLFLQENTRSDFRFMLIIGPESDHWSSFSLTP